MTMCNNINCTFSTLFISLNKYGFQSPVDMHILIEDGLYSEQ